MQKVRARPIPTLNFHAVGRHWMHMALLREGFVFSQGINERRIEIDVS